MPGAKGGGFTVGGKPLSESEKKLFKARPSDPIKSGTGLINDLNATGISRVAKARQEAASGKAKTRKDPLKDNSKAKSKPNKRFNKPTGTGLVKRTRANSGGKAARAKSVLDDKESTSKTKNKLG